MGAAVIGVAVPLMSLEAQPSGGLTFCAGQRITRVIVRTEPPIYGSRAARLPIVARTQRMLHVNTRASVIRDFLLLQPGDRCNEARRAESERILRAQPYLADARVLVLDDGPNQVELDVHTVDEVATVAALRIATDNSPYVRKVRLGSQNVAGLGFYLSGEWQSGLAYRDGIAGRLITSQLWGEPLQFTLTGARRPLGGDWLVELSQPFLTDFQRLAWDAVLGMDADYQGYHRADGEPIALRTDRRFGTVGFITRVGAPGALALVGSSVSYEREETARQPVFIRDTGLVFTSDPVLDGRFGEQRTARVNLLLGFRDISFLRVTGFEALEGPQDVWRGFQVGTLAGKGLRRLFGTDRDDIFLNADAYFGFGNARTFLASRAAVESGRDQATGSWNRGLGTANVTWYRRLLTSHTLVSRVVWSGGWRSLVPFQLVLDDNEAGVIAFSGSRAGGGRRVIGRVEDRWYIGRPSGSVAVGAAMFVEAGKLWAGDVPFGVTTPVAVSAGIGLLAAVPPRSQRLWRLDLAARLTDDPHAGKWELRFTNRDRTRELLAEPPDVTRSRMRSVPTNLFVWPRGWALQRQ